MSFTKMARPEYKRPEVYEPDKDLQFNKDIATLYEIQRLEKLVHDFGLLGQNAQRLRALKDWASKIRPLFVREEIEKLNELVVACRSPRTEPGTHNVFYQFNEAALDKLLDFLNVMMVVHNIHFTKKKSELDALDVF